MAPPPLLSLLSLLSLLTLSPSTSQTTITLSLSPPPKPPHKTPWQGLTHLAASSIARANHLKHPHKRNYSVVSPTEIPLFPHTYGGYSVSLGLGTPPQTLSLLLDTGSSLVWVPCTTHYTCTECDFPSVNHANISTFAPRQSSSAKILGCKNPKCAWLFGPSVLSQCKDCAGTGTLGNCTRICPAYRIQYGSGSTSGILLSETLELSGKSVQDFLVGCSIISTRQPSGIVGFGRGTESLPAQMGLKKFSYCLVSHRFDEEPVSSDLTLATGSHSGVTKTDGLSYTPFLKNKLGSDSAFEEYYYVNLRKITVGGKHVSAPYDLLVPGSDGHGGTIVDSGTTFTFMEGKVYEAVAREFERQMAHYSREADVEKQSGFRPCYNVSGGGKDQVLQFPELVFHFKGGGKMELPLADYFSVVGESMAVCMTIVTDTGGDTGGPSIILGNYQQQDIYFEYDLENERLGFRKQTCK